MRVLIISSGNNKGVLGVSSFVYEQYKSLQKQGVYVELFPIKAKGIRGYLKTIRELRKYLRKNKVDILHGHYLTSTLVSLFQFKIPIVSSFIGCDINLAFNRFLAKIFVFKRTSATIFVSEQLHNLSGYKGKKNVIPYGIDVSTFNSIAKNEARNKLKWSENEHYVLFASRFDRLEKNAQLAKEAIQILNNKGLNCKLVEFKDISIEDIRLYYNASDLFLLTSIREGSPQTIKEAMACNCPIVSTDVGDVRWVIGDTKGCYISSFEPEDVAAKIEQALEFSKTKGRTNGRERIISLGLDADTTAQKIIEVYRKVLKSK